MSSRARRLGALSLAAIIVPAGLAARFVLPEPIGDAAGGVLYAVLVYLLTVVVWPAVSWRTTAGIALAFVLAVEFAQLTHVPAALGAALPPARLVFGSTFAWFDLASGAAGVALAAVVDSRMRAAAHSQPRGLPGSGG